MKSVRPHLLSVLCILGLIGCFLKMIIVISPPVQQVNHWYPVYLSLSTVCQVAALAGLWLMRRWAFWFFFLFFLVDQSVYLGLGSWNERVLILELAILGTSFFYYRRMT